MAHFFCSKRKASKWLSKILDECGYGTERRVARIAYWDKWSQAKAISTREILKTDRIHDTYVGSKMEGIAMEKEGDLDVLQINYNIHCYNDLTETLPNDKICFQLERESVPDGYCLLRLVDNHEIDCDYFEKIKFAFRGKGGNQYLSSEQYMTLTEDILYNVDSYFSKKIAYKDRHGPSIPRYFEKSKLDTLLDQTLSKDFHDETDFVRAFPCSCPDLLEAWCQRQRTKDWPSKATIQQVCQSNIYVVPVGESGTQDEDLQWRISFVEAELCLARSFNDTQAKVYILLKHIAKKLLAPICDDITSYVIKNVMFWLAEKSSKKRFKRKFLIARLADGLCLMRDSIEKKNLPNYMVPERNLFTGKLNINFEKLLETIDDIIQKCPSYICRIKQCSSIENKHPKLYSFLKEIQVFNEVDSIALHKSSFLSTTQCAERILTLYRSPSEVEVQEFHCKHVVEPLERQHQHAITKLHSNMPSFLRKGQYRGSRSEVKSLEGHQQQDISKLHPKVPSFLHKGRYRGGQSEVEPLEGQQQHEVSDSLYKWLGEMPNKESIQRISYNDYEFPYIMNSKPKCCEFGVWH